MSHRMIALSTACVAGLAMGLLGCKEKGYENPSRERAPKSGAQPTTPAAPTHPPATAPAAHPSLPPGHPPLGGKDALTQPDPSGVAPAMPRVTAGAGADRLKLTPPGNWKPVRPRGPRVQQFAVPRAEGDSEDAEVVVFYFGQGQGGSAAANIQRWIGMFTQPDGSDSSEIAKQDEMEVNGLKVATVDVNGNYRAAFGPGAGQSKPNSRLIGGIVETPGGRFFIRMTGPAKTVEAAREAFLAYLKSAEYE